MEADQKTVPTCIGIIMDGNRRWARERGLSTVEGHTAGYKKLVEVTRWAGERACTHLMFYAFSTENWGRSQEEIDGLMGLFVTAFAQYKDEAIRENVRILVAGQRERLSPELQRVVALAENETAENTGLTVTLCVSYGGRPEIVEAVNGCLADGLTRVDEGDIAQRLWTHSVPYPDMIIRTGGERRLSNFLTWQSVYSELFFTNTYWPDFAKDELDAMLEEYAGRERRRGK